MYVYGRNKSNFPLVFSRKMLLLGINDFTYLYVTKIIDPKQRLRVMINSLSLRREKEEI